MCFFAITTAFLDNNYTLHTAISSHSYGFVKSCKRDVTTDLYTDEQGNILTKGDIIFCKKQPCVVTEEGYIEHYSSGAMDNIFQALDSELVTLQEKVKSQKSDRNWSFIGRMLLSLMGNNKPIKKQAAIQKPLIESNEGIASSCSNFLDRSYINKKDLSKSKDPAPVADNDAQNAKCLVVVNFNKNAMNILGNYSITWI